MVLFVFDVQQGFFHPPHAMCPEDDLCLKLSVVWGGSEGGGAS